MFKNLIESVEFDYYCSLTLVFINYDNAFLEEVYQLPIEEIKKRYLRGEELIIVKIPEIFLANCFQALKTGEPGFSFNFLKYFEPKNRLLSFYNK